MKPIELVQELLNSNVFTQNQIAECMGVDQSTISKWKNGDRNMTANQFEMLCSIYGYSIMDYLNGVEYRPLSFAFSASRISSEDIKMLGKIGSIFSQLRLMETLDSNETRL